MIIVSGFLKVDPAHRDSYLDGCLEVVRAARAADGCIDFHISADSIEPGRVNVFEQWQSVDAVEAFRGSGPTDDQQTAIVDAQVLQHDIASSISLT